MSKQQKVTTPAVPSTTPVTEALTAEPVGSTEIVAPATATAIVEEVDVSVHALTRKYKEALPHMAAYLDQVAPPSTNEIQTAVAALDAIKRDAFIAALARMNPVKLGQHTTRQEFRLPEMRIFHGTGSDELRPSDAPNGSIYSTDGRILAAPKAALANLKHNPKHAKLGTTVTGFLIAVHEAHTFWPPRNGALPPNVEVRANVPICRSLDRKRGDYFGSCEACAYRPFKDGKPNKDGCRNEDHLYFVLSDFSGVYRFVVHGKSIKPGSAAVKKKSRPWATYFQHPFELEAREETQGTDRWFELAASVSTDVEAPTPVEAALLTALARQVDYEIFFPQLAAIYTAEPKHVANGGASGASDMDALMAAANAPATGAPVKDVSKTNI